MRYEILKFKQIAKNPRGFSEIESSVSNLKSSS